MLPAHPPGGAVGLADELGGPGWTCNVLATATHSSTLAWKNPMDGGTWEAAVHGVATSRTRLKRLSNSMDSQFHPGNQPIPQVSKPDTPTRQRDHGIILQNSQAPTKSRSTFSQDPLVINIQVKETLPWNSLAVQWLVLSLWSPGSDRNSASWILSRSVKRKKKNTAWVTNAYTDTEHLTNPSGPECAGSQFLVYFHSVHIKESYQPQGKGGLPDPA